MMDLTKEEVLKKYEEYNQLLELYHPDGSPKLMAVGLERVEVEEVVDGDDNITEKWSKDNQQLLDNIIKWAETVKYIYIVDFVCPYPLICYEEIKRLGDMLSGTSESGALTNFLVLSNGEKYHLYMKHPEDDDMSLIDKIQPYWLCMSCLDNKLRITFKCNLVLDEVRKHYELSKEIDGLVGEKERLK